MDTSNLAPSKAPGKYPTPLPLCNMISPDPTIPRTCCASTAYNPFSALSSPSLLHQLSILTPSALHPFSILSPSALHPYSALSSILLVSFLHHIQIEIQRLPSRLKIGMPAQAGISGCLAAAMAGCNSTHSEDIRRHPILPAAILGRARNKVKFNIWGFYLKGEGKKLQTTLRRLKAAAQTHKARVPGRANQALALQKVSRNKVQIGWPRPVSADACARVLKLALGDTWRDLVTDPAGVQGADQTAATAEEEVPTPRAATAGASCSGTLVSRAATVEEPKFEAASLTTRSMPHLLSLKLEVITALYNDKHGSRYEDLQQAYTVNWAAELGQGTYGKVYIGTSGSATDTADKDTAAKGTSGSATDTSFAIKMLRDNITETKKTSSDAIWAAEEEVRRHAALGLHPNIIKLVDVGLFWEPSRSAHIGLVCDMYENDVRQFLKKSSFTPGGMRHVLNSVLEGLRFIHDRGCIHSDLKPANIFMRGAIHLRGCFSRETVKLQQLDDFLYSDLMTEFQYQIPTSFEVRKGLCLNHA